MRLLVILNILLSFTAQAQKPFIRDVYLNESNAPVKVYDLLQEKDGYMWLATDAGIYRFNGRSFIRINDSVRVPATAIASYNGSIWVGYKNGKIGCVTGSSVATVSIPNINTNSAITSLESIGRYVLVVCTEDNGLFLVMNNRAIAYNTGTGLSDNFVYGAAAMSDNRLLVITDKGINELSFDAGNISINVLTTTNGLPDNIVRVIKPFRDRSWFWLGTQQGGIAIYNGHTRRIWNPDSTGNWKWGQVNDILPMGNDRAWIATDEGYLLEAKLTDSAHLTVNPVEVADRKINRLTLGRSGILWGATNQGLVMTTPEYMEYIPLRTPFKLSELRAMVCGKDNTLWFAQNKTLYRLPLNKAGNMQQQLSLPADVTSLYMDDKNRLWIGTLGRGLFCYENGRLAEINYIPVLTNESILDITGTSDRLWVSGLNGVQEIFYPGDFTQKMSLFRKHNKNTGIGSDYIYQLYTDRKDRIWMATDGAGVCMFDGSNYHKWDSTTGINSQVVYTVTQDAYGNIWAATLYNGLYRYDGKRWDQLARVQGLQDVNISTLAANGTGQVIAVHAKGIDVWYPRSGQFRNYSRRQGFNIDSTSSVLKLCTNDRQGNAYIPFEQGFLIFKNIMEPYDIRPFVNLLSVSIFFKPVPLGSDIFSHNQNHISFNFDGINFANPERLHYRYKLEGYSDNWIVTNDESVTFPQLSAGTYKFRVQASLNNTFSTLGEASYSFVIEKPFWRRTWFIMLSIAALLGLAYTYMNLREKNLRKLSLLQRERMMFEYENLKSQVNPHFLFNSLNTLTSLIDEDKEAAQEYTVHLSDLYRNMLSYRDKDLVLLEEEWEILQNYLHIQQTRFGNALKLNAFIPKRLMKTKKIVPLALQLLVENAIKHNVVSIATPLTINIEADDEVITVKNRLQTKFSKEKGAGLGLINIRKRYGLLTKKQITFGIENNEYIVILPLL